MQTIRNNIVLQFLLVIIWYSLPCWPFCARKALLTVVGAFDYHCLCHGAEKHLDSVAVLCHACYSSFLLTFCMAKHHYRPTNVSRALSYSFKTSKGSGQGRGNKARGLRADTSKSVENQP
eukprot:750235-Hanusia_phi.AAC.1